MEHPSRNYYDRQWKQHGQSFPTTLQRKLDIVEDVDGEDSNEDENDDRMLDGDEEDFDAREIDHDITFKYLKELAVLHTLFSLLCINSERTSHYSNL